MQITKGIKVRLYPNVKQKEQLAQMFGNDRKVWNTLLDMINNRYNNNPKSQFLSEYDLNYLLPQLKRELIYLKYSDSSSLQVVVHNLVQSFKMLFKHQGGHPHFHSKNSTRQSYTSKSSTIRIVAKRYLKLPKLGYIKSSKTKRLLEGKIKRFTISLEPTGHYQLSAIIECESQAFKKTSKQVGIDLGLADLIICSDSTQKKINKFTTKHLDQKARLWQRKFDRRKNQAKVNIRQYNHNHQNMPEMDLNDYTNWAKARIHKARLQRAIKNKRYAYLQRVTTQLVKNYDVIVIENLKAKNMMKNHNLAESIAHACWRQIRNMLTYKCKWYGKQLIVVNPRNTSRICSNCGQLQQQFKDLTTNEWLQIREWQCENCHAKHDRDRNAAINIRKRGLAQIQTN